MLEVLISVIGQKHGMKVLHIVKEEVKWSLFLGYMVVYIENLKESMNHK